MFCPLCGERKLVPIFKKGAHRFFECPRCLHVRVFPYPTPEATQSYYETAFSPDYLAHNQEWFKVLAKRRMQTVGAYFPEGFSGSLLDAGSGYGFFLREAKNQGWNPLGIESSACERDYATRILGVSVVDKDLSEALEGLPDSSFDVITFWHTLEHLEEPGRAIEQAIRLLKKDGLLLLNSPNLASMVFRILGRRWSWIYVPGHVQYFRVRPFSAWLETKGLQLRAIETMTDAPNLYFMIEEGCLLTLAVALMQIPGISPAGHLARKIACGWFHQQWVQLRLRTVYNLTPGLDSYLRSRLLGHEFLLALSKQPEALTTDH